MKKICMLLLVCALLLPFAGGLSEEEMTVYGWQGDVAFFMQNGKVGLVNRQGQVLAAPQFDGGGLFTPGGVAEVVAGNQSGAINKAGEMVIPLSEGCFLQQDCGCADAQTGLMFFLHPDRTLTLYTPAGEVLAGRRWLQCSPFVKGSAVVQGEEGWNLLLADGRLLCPQWYDDARQDAITGGGMFVRGGETVCLDAEGKILYTEDETGITAWTNGEGGEMVSRPPQWSDVSLLSGDKIMYQKDGLWGLAKRDGTPLTLPVWEYFTYFGSMDKMDMPLVVYTKEYKAGLLSPEGTLLLEPVYSRLEGLSPNAFVAWAGEDGYAPIKTVDASGNLIQLLPEGSWHSSFFIGAKYQQYTYAGKEPTSGWYLLSQDGTIALKGEEPELDFLRVVENDAGCFIALKDQQGVYYLNEDGVKLTDPEWAEPLFADKYYLITAKKDGSAHYKGMMGQPDFVLPYEYAPGNATVVDGNYYIHVAQVDGANIRYAYVNGEGQLLYDPR